MDDGLAVAATPRLNSDVPSSPIGGGFDTLAAAFDWSRTTLGPIATWPSSLRTATRLILRAAVPMAILWGDDGIMIYNDAYAAFVGDKHPGLLGGRARDGWPEHAAFFDNIVTVGRAGGTLAYRDQELTLNRTGRPEPFWFNLHCSPVVDEAGPPAGVLAIVIETTKRIMAVRAHRTAETQTSGVLENIAEGFVLLDAGFRVLRINQETLRLEHRAAAEIVGKTHWEAWPGSEDSVLGQTYKRAMRERTAVSLEHHYVWPGGRAAWIEMRAYPSGEGLAIFYRDVTARNEAEARQSALLRLSDRLRVLDDPVAMASAASETIGTTLEIDRAAYGAVDIARETIHFERHWTASDIETRPATIAFRDIGGAIDGLKRGEVVALSDATRDPAIVPAALRPVGIRASLMMPVTEAGALVAIFVLGHGRVRDWRAEDIAFLREIADRTRAAIERRRAEQGLLALTASLERQVASRTADRNRLWCLSTDLILMAGFDGTITAVNPAWTVLLGWLEAELIDTNVLALVHPDNLDEMRAALAALSAGTALAPFESRLRHKDGKHRCINWAAVAGDGLVNAVGRDVSAEKETARALRLAESRIRAIFQTTGQFQGFLSPDGTLLDANPAALAAIMAPIEAVAGRAFWDTPWFTDTPGMVEQMRAGVSAAARGETICQDVTLDLPVGQRSFDFALRPIVDPHGQIIGIAPDAIDTTDRRTTEEALRQSQKMEAVGQLTGGLAHDFNNMLGVVVGSLDLLGRHADTADARVQRYLTAASEGARRAALLTQRLLAFSRQQPLWPKSVDVNALVAGITELVRHALGGTVSVETTMAGDLWRTCVDPNQLENVILNLAVNARDAMRDGGRVTIETQNTHLDDRCAAANGGIAPGPYILIAVSDTGTGMPATVLAKAFDPFFTTKDVGKGTGLGLSQVYGFVKQSGGHVRLYSELGRGTTVKIYLPRDLAADPVEALDSSSADLPVDRGQQVVLVVDDEQAMRRFSVEALTELGYGVLEADGASDALRLLDDHPEIALLFTDVVMPDIDGCKLAAAARLRRADLPVLFTTGYTRNALVHNGMLNPGVDLLGKPFTIADLATKVSKALDAHHASR